MDQGSPPAIGRIASRFKTAEFFRVFAGAHRGKSAAVSSQPIASGRSGFEGTARANTVNSAKHLRDPGEIPVPGRRRCRQAPGPGGDVFAYQGDPVSDTDRIPHAGHKSCLAKPFQANVFIVWQARKESVFPVFHALPADQVVRSRPHPPDRTCPATGQDRPP